VGIEEYKECGNQKSPIKVAQTAVMAIPEIAIITISTSPQEHIVNVDLFIFKTLHHRFFRTL